MGITTTTSPETLSTDEVTSVTRLTTVSNQLGHRTHVFEGLVVVIGFIGLLSNATVLFAIIMSKRDKNGAFNELIVNQMSLDLFSCIWLIVSYAVVIAQNVENWSCMLFFNESLLWWGLYSSKVNLISISIERYIMIVHPIWHRNNAKPWMIHSAVGVSWLAGFAFSVPVSSVTTLYVDRVCNINVYWGSTAAQTFYGIVTFLVFFVAVLGSFLFCYGSILVVLHRQARVNAVQQVGNHPAPVKAMQEARTVRNTIKTMIIVSIGFIVCWLPCDLYLMLMYVLAATGEFRFIYQIYQPFLFVAFSNVCLNPLIYAAKYDVVKKKLIKIAQCSKDTGSVE